MTDELFIKMILSLVTLLATIITAFVIPYFKSKMTDVEYEKLKWYVNCAVRCAEQIYTPEEWKEKKAYVMDKAINFVSDTLKITLTPADIEVIVEGIVNEVKKG